MKEKYIYPFLFLFSLSLISYGQHTETNDKIVKISTKSELTTLLEEELSEVDFPNKYARSIFKIGVDYNGEVLELKSINHPYNEVNEELLKGWLSNTVWLNLHDTQFFYLIIEIENGTASVNYKKN